MTAATIYMDYQSTTPCDERVLQLMLPYFCKNFANPHSTDHIMGRSAMHAIELARKKIAKLINVENPNEIIFTSGATESNNLAIQGVAHFYRSRGNRIIISAIEHKCVMETCESLKYEGFDVITIPVGKNGIINIQKFKQACTEEAILASVMTVNNEIGVIQPIDEISAICRERGILFHTDAAQAVGKINVDASKVDLMSISGHKIYGPKGIGALYVRMKPRIRLKPLFFGGGQERGMRSGTLPTPLCVGLGAACEIAMQEMSAEAQRLMQFKDHFIKEMSERLPKSYLNGDSEKRIPGCLNFSFDGVEGEGIMLGIPNICMSSGSACTSLSLEPSYVLKAISLQEDLIHSSIRIGFGRFTTLDEVNQVIKSIIEVVNRLRAMSPLWM